MLESPRKDFWNQQLNTLKAVKKSTGKWEQLREGKKAEKYNYASV